MEHPSNRHVVAPLLQDPQNATWLNLEDVTFNKSEKLQSSSPTLVLHIHF